MTFLQGIIAVLAVSMLCFLVTIIVLANRKKFFRVITLNTLIFVGYCFVAYHYEVIFNNDLFGKGRVIFLLTCVFLHSLISMIIVIKSEKSNFSLNNKEQNKTTTPQKNSSNVKDD
ncbi:MAG: hypothetical protein Q4G18_07945 [Myroides sp.]|nr:hypothetical protein [Myroides sp.]